MFCFPYHITPFPGPSVLCPQHHGGVIVSGWASSLRYAVRTSIHLPPSVHVCVHAYAPSEASLFKPWDLVGCQGFQGSILPLGIKILGLLSAALASRIFPWQVVRALLLAEVEQILPVQAGSAALQLTLVLLTATEEARLAQENQILPLPPQSCLPRSGPPNLAN